ncbi:MAG: tetratricopeptide repeat protein [Planctomycetia bacterium]|jgi:tetratricopeptide (TPR) repeat protein
MHYDRYGFPIPPDFEVDPRLDELPAGSLAAPTVSNAKPSAPRSTGGRKRLVIVALAAALILPALLLPEVAPAIRQMVVEWSLEQAMQREARDDLAGAIDEIGRAIRWHGEDVDLLCMRSMLRLEDRDAAGALEDAGRAATIAPTSPQPLRVRALANVVLGNADAALADAELVVDIAAPGDPDALNHRAYIRALVGRDLPAALADIDTAIAAQGDAAPELLDTRGYILHLLGRTQEAIDQLNLAIDSMQQNRRRLVGLSGRADRTELARRLRMLDHGLAVMLHHRALACEKAGLEEQAKQDFALAKKKGFDPSRGIF